MAAAVAQSSASVVSRRIHVHVVCDVRYTVCVVIAWLGYNCRPRSYHEIGQVSHR